MIFHKSKESIPKFIQYLTTKFVKINFTTLFPYKALQSEQKDKKN